MPIRVYLFALLLVSILFTQAQQSPEPDTAVVPVEVLNTDIDFSEPPKKGLFNHDSIPWPNPKYAFRLSALLPGAGQIYNKGYWKPPIIYAGFGVFSYLILNHHSQFKAYRNSYISKTTQLRDDPFPQYSLSAVQLQRNFHRQNRDMMFLLGAVWYALNIVEAFVDAHMKHFDVSEEITLHVMPTPVRLQGPGTAQFAPGLRAGIRF